MMRAFIIALCLLAAPAFAQSGGALAPTSNSVIGIVPIVSGTAVNTLVIKAAPGNLYSVYATNSSATGGFLLVFNATSAPSDGTVSPIDCVPIAGTSTSGINYAPGPPKVFTIGIVAVLSTGATCFTKTTSGGVTGFISASAP